MNKIFITLICIQLSALLLFGSKDSNIYFHPVEEVYVDELPEWIMDMDYVHSVSKLPVVFRGAAKNWEAMNWTPESLSARGLTGIEKLMKNSEDPGREFYDLKVAFQVDGEKLITGGRITPCGNFISSARIKEVLKDVHFYEKNPYIDISDRDIQLLKENTHFNLGHFTTDAYIYSIIAGSKGFQMKVFHNHETVLLAEFYGERVVFLAPPHSMSSHNEHELLIKASDDAIERNEIEMDPLSNIQNGTFSALQQVILKPGDILYIPSGWYHRVHYLTPCLGVVQDIKIDRMNFVF